MEKFKVLAVADGGVKTGFARVMESIIEHFPKEFDVSQLAINFWGDPYPSRAKLYPASLGGDVYGFSRIRSLVEEIKPDRIFILQDSWVIQGYLKRIPEEYLEKTVLYVPVDAGPYQPEWLELFPKVKQVVAYTEFGKSVLLEANPDIENIKVIPHGVDTSTFFPIEQDEARDRLQKINKDWKVFLNLNRNQPRKRIDICAKAFGLFAQDKDDVRYYHHAGVEDAGYNIVKLARRCGFSKKLILTSRDISPQKYVSDEMLNVIYNSTDFGINFSMGEGFGLCFAEDTKVLTTEGYKKIQDIVVGDEVFGKEGLPTKVTKLYRRQYSGKLRELKFAGCCETIKATPEHPFYSNDSWVEAKDLKIKEKVLRPDISARELYSSIDVTKYTNLQAFNSWALIRRKNVGSVPDKYEMKDIRYLLNRNVSRRDYRKFKRDIPLGMDLTYLITPYLLDRKNGPAYKETTEATTKAAENLFQHKFIHSNNIILGDAICDFLNKVAYDETLYLSLPIESIQYIFNTLLERQSYQHPTNQRVLLSAKLKEKQNIIRIVLLRLGVGFSEFVIKDGTIYFTLDKRYVDFAEKFHQLKSKKEDISGYECNVIKNDEVDYTGTVYNLETESHTYNVMGYLVHNCNVEHSMAAKGQIVGAHSANNELYADGRGLLVPITHYDTMPKILTEGAVVSVQHAAQALQYAYDNPEEMREMGRKAREYFLQDEFRWENVSKQFQELLK